MPTVKVKKVRAADPGFACILDFDSAPFDTMKIDLSVSDPNSNTYTSHLIIDNQVSDLEMPIVMPFGDRTFQQGVLMRFTLTVTIGSGQPQQFTGVVRPLGGEFDYSPTLSIQSTRLNSGESIVSPDGNFMGIMQTDGNFVAYPVATMNSNSDSPTAASNTNQNNPVNYYAYAANGFLYIADANSTNIIATSYPQQPNWAGCIQINSSGKICLGNGSNSNDLMFPVSFI